jgi:hypothetical protein
MRVLGGQRCEVSQQALSQRPAARSIEGAAPQREVGQRLLGARSVGARAPETWAGSASGTRIGVEAAPHDDGSVGQHLLDVPDSEAAAVR